MGGDAVSEEEAGEVGFQCSCPCLLQPVLKTLHSSLYESVRGGVIRRCADMPDAVLLHEVSEFLAGEHCAVVCPPAFPVSRELRR